MQSIANKLQINLPSLEDRIKPTCGIIKSKIHILYVSHRVFFSELLRVRQQIAWNAVTTDKLPALLVENHTW